MSFENFTFSAVSATLASRLIVDATLEDPGHGAVIGGVAIGESLSALALVVATAANLLVVQRLVGIVAAAYFEQGRRQALVGHDYFGWTTLFDHVLHDARVLALELGRFAALGHEFEAILARVAAQLNFSHLRGFRLDVVVPGCIAQH